MDAGGETSNIMMTESSLTNYFRRLELSKLLSMLTWVGLLVSAWLAARLVWSVVEWQQWAPPSTQVALPTGKAVTGLPELDVATVARDLFGVAERSTETTTEEVVTEAPETALQLRLRGVFASKDKKKSNAVIENERGEQEVYFIGDEIAGHRGVVLYDVHPNRVILKHNGQFETLTMDEQVLDALVAEPGQTSLNGEKPKGAYIDKRNNQMLTRKLQALRQKLNEDPMALAQLIQVTPELKDGQMIGVKVAPGKDAALFARAGLRRNDIITAINGIPLDGPQAAITLRDTILSADELTLQVIRGNQPITLVFSLNENAQKDIPRLR